MAAELIDAPPAPSARERRLEAMVAELVDVVEDLQDTLAERDRELAAATKAVDAALSAVRPASTGAWDDDLPF